MDIQESNGVGFSGSKGNGNGGSIGSPSGRKMRKGTDTEGCLSMIRRCLDLLKKASRMTGRDDMKRSVLVYD